MSHPKPLPFTQAEIRELIDYDPATGLVVWKAAAGRGCEGRIAGCPDAKGHLRIRFRGKSFRLHRVIWLWMTGVSPDFEIDHEDRVKSNNRWANLRPADDSLNAMNRSLQANNTSGFKGVHMDERGRYVAQIRAGGQKHKLGRYATAAEAAAAYDCAAQRLHGSHAYTNH